jgi:hypothetical protein
MQHQKSEPAPRPGTLPQPRVELKRTLRILVSIPTTQNEDKDQRTRDELYRKLEMYYGSDIKVVLLRPGTTTPEPHPNAPPGAPPLAIHFGPTGPALTETHIIPPRDRA